MAYIANSYQHAEDAADERAQANDDRYAVLEVFHSNAPSGFHVVREALVNEYIAAYDYDAEVQYVAGPYQES